MTAASSHVDHRRTEPGRRRTFRPAALVALVGALVFVDGRDAAVRCIEHHQVRVGQRPLEECIHAAAVAIRPAAHRPLQIAAEIDLHQVPRNGRVDARAADAIGQQARRGHI